MAELARAVEITVGERVTADGTDVTEAIRGPEVNAAVSVVAANPEVHAVLVERQRRWVGARDGSVVEGRDIGSVVLPKADLKVFLTASDDERARRRADEDPEAMAKRDRIDRTRSASPLEIAEGAHVLDTTGRSVDEIVEEVVAWL